MDQFWRELPLNESAIRIAMDADEVIRHGQELSIAEPAHPTLGQCMCLAAFYVYLVRDARTLARVRTGFERAIPWLERAARNYDYLNAFVIGGFRLCAAVDMHKSNRAHVDFVWAQEWIHTAFSVAGTDSIPLSVHLMRGSNFPTQEQAVDMYHQIWRENHDITALRAAAHYAPDPRKRARFFKEMYEWSPTYDCLSEMSFMHPFLFTPVGEWMPVWRVHRWCNTETRVQIMCVFLLRERGVRTGTLWGRIPKDIALLIAAYICSRPMPMFDLERVHPFLKVELSRDRKRKMPLK